MGTLLCNLSLAPRNGYRLAEPRSQGRKVQAQVEAHDSEPQQFLHGREMPRLPPNHHCLQPRADCCSLRELQCDALPAYWRSCTSYRGLLLQAQSGVRELSEGDIRWIVSWRERVREMVAIHK